MPVSTQLLSGSISETSLLFSLFIKCTDMYTGLKPRWTLIVDLGPIKL